MKEYIMLAQVGNLTPGTIVVQVPSRDKDIIAVCERGHHVPNSPEQYPALGVFPEEVQEIAVRKEGEL